MPAHQGIQLNSSDHFSLVEQKERAGRQVGQQRDSGPDLERDCECLAQQLPGLPF